MPHPANPIIARAFDESDSLHEALALRVRQVIAEMRLAPGTTLTDAHRRHIMRTLEPDFALLWGASAEDTDAGVYQLATRAARLGSLLPMQQQMDAYTNAFGPEVMAGAMAEAATDATD